MGFFSRLFGRAEPETVHVPEYRAKPKAAPLAVHVPSPDYVKSILGYRSPPVEVKPQEHNNAHRVSQNQWKPHESQGPWGSQICISGSYGSMGPPLVALSGMCNVTGFSTSYAIGRGGGGGSGGYVYMSG